MSLEITKISQHLINSFRTNDSLANAKTIARQGFGVPAQVILKAD